MRKYTVASVAVLTTMALALAACGSPKSSTPAKTDGSGTKKEAVFYGNWPYEVPPKGHFNWFSTGNLSMGGSPYTEMMTEPLAEYYWANNTWEPFMATKWEQDDKAQTITVHLREGAKWSDGSDFTSQDVLTYMSIAKAKSYTVWRYVDKVTAPDKNTVVFHLGNPATIALRYVLKIQPQPTSVYGDWAKKFQDLFDGGKDKGADGKDSDDMKKLKTDFDAFRPADYVADGPYKMNVKNITEAQMELDKNATAWDANLVKFDKIVLFDGDTKEVTPLILDKKMDFSTSAFPPATEQQFTAQGIRIVRYPFYTGPALTFNQSAYPFNRVEVRQAIAYAVDRSQAGTVALAKSGVAVQKMAGISDNMVNAWMTPDAQAKLNPYKLDTKKAADLLTSIGFKKGADGVWVDDKGKQMSFELSVPSDFSDWSAAADNVAQQLTAFGIKTVVRGTPWAQYQGDMQTGKFVMCMLPWGSSIPHPQYGFLADLVTYNAGGQKGDTQAPGMNFPLKTKVDGKDVDLDALITDSGKGSDTNAQKAVISQLALAYNQLLPQVPLFERYSNSPTLENVHVSGWPKDGDPILVNGSADSFVTIMILTGKLGPAN